MENPRTQRMIKRLETLIEMYSGNTRIVKSLEGQLKSYRNVTDTPEQIEQLSKVMEIAFPIDNTVIISTWLGDEDKTMSDACCAVLDMKSVRNRIHIEKRIGSSWMDYTIYDFDGAKVLVASGMPDSFWFAC